MKQQPGRVFSDNVVHAITRGPARDTAIDKRPVAGPVHVGSAGLAGDIQCDQRHHGGPDKAVYAYAIEDSLWWEQQLQRGIAPGTFGENLNTADVDVTHAIIGERWRIGGPSGPLLEVRMPRSPCANLAARMGIARFQHRFDATGRVGAYLSVLHEGTVHAGATVEVESRPSHGITVADACAASDPAAMRRLLDSPVDLAPPMRGLAQRALTRLSRR